MNQQAVYYFDNNATTRVAPEVVDAMIPFLREQWGNPSSTYVFGRQVGEHVDRARARVAALINAEPREIIFTSCGTESDNSAIHSALVTQPEKRHVLTTAVEHSANLKFCELLVKRGYTVTLLPVAPDGTLDLDLLERSIRPDTAIVSVMWANNETGVLFPVRDIASICRRNGVLFHTDAVQAPGRSVAGAAAQRTSRTSLPLGARRSWRWRICTTKTVAFARCGTGWRRGFWAAFPAARAMGPRSRGCRIPAISHLRASRRKAS